MHNCTSIYRYPCALHCSNEVRLWTEHWSLVQKRAISCPALNDSVISLNLQNGTNNSDERQTEDHKITLVEAQIKPGGLAGDDDDRITILFWNKIAHKILWPLARRKSRMAISMIRCPVIPFQKKFREKDWHGRMTQHAAVCVSKHNNWHDYGANGLEGNVAASPALSWINFNCTASLD